MYQHPAALAINASYYQHEAERHARQRHLEDEAHEGDAHHAAVQLQHRLVAVAVAVLAVVGVVAVI